MKLTQVLDFVLNHPLNQGNRWQAFMRVVRWQLAVRVLGEAEFSLPYVNGTRLLVTRGMTGATGNFYCGLHEQDEMGFVLHVLRAGELFVDIGANVGSYTVLAGSVGAQVVAVEPIPSTFERLAANVRLNAMTERVSLHRVGLSDKAGTLRFTSGGDTINHVLAEGEVADAVEVPVTTLDALLGGAVPSLIKIDVEGHESFVLSGATATLSSPALLAVIMETNGAGERYGVSDAALLGRMSALGFSPFVYSAMGRALSPLDSRANAPVYNTVFVARGKEDEIRRRVASAGRTRLINGTI